MIIKYKAPVVDFNTALISTNANFSKAIGTEGATYSDVIASVASVASDIDEITFTKVSRPD